MSIIVPAPDVQISFASALAEIRTLFLQDALSATVAQLDIPTIDKELATAGAVTSVAATPRVNCAGRSQQRPRRLITSSRYRAVAAISRVTLPARIVAATSKKAMLKLLEKQIIEKSENV